MTRTAKTLVPDWAPLISVGLIMFAVFAPMALEVNHRVQVFSHGVTATQAHVLHCTRGKRSSCEVEYMVDGHRVQGGVNTVDADGNDLHAKDVVDVEYANREASLVRLTGDDPRDDRVILLGFLAVSALVALIPAVALRVQSGTWPRFWRAFRQAWLPRARRETSWDPRPARPHQGRSRLK